MVRFWFSFILAALIGSAAATAQLPYDPETEAAREIQSDLKIQADAWNAGDLEGFMKYYWKSDQLVFCSGGKRRRGWQTVLDGYRAKYDTPEKMGQLAFSDLDVTLLAGNVALVIGDWQLTFKEGEPYGGNFSLIMKKLDEGWRVVHDHTSSLAP